MWEWLPKMTGSVAGFLKGFFTRKPPSEPVRGGDVNITGGKGDDGGGDVNITGGKGGDGRGGSRGGDGGPVNIRGGDAATQR